MTYVVFTHHFGHKLGYRVYDVERHIEHSRHVLYRSFRRHGAEGDYLRSVGSAVLFDDVFNRALASVHAEVDVEVGVGYTFRV